uniref:Uncharacterized protein n=1 Tax=Anguilla anguilla TaxID=7936 RepID=A0A0E9PHM4_ANGAN
MSYLLFLLRQRLIVRVTQRPSQ